MKNEQISTFSEHDDFKKIEVTVQRLFYTTYLGDPQYCS
jgi:hypothetical protein